MDLLIATTLIQKQEDMITQDKVTTPATAVTKDINYDWEFLNALDSTGVRHKAKVGDKMATVIPTPRLDSELDRRPYLIFLASLLRHYWCYRGRQVRLEH